MVWSSCLLNVSLWRSTGKRPGGTECCRGYIYVSSRRIWKVLPGGGILSLLPLQPNDFMFEIFLIFHFLIFWLWLLKKYFVFMFKKNNLRSFHLKCISNKQLFGVIFDQFMHFHKKLNVNRKIKFHSSTVPELPNLQSSTTVPRPPGHVRDIKVRIDLIYIYTCLHSEILFWKC